ncbi:shugoshin 1 [Microcaecilia unicolor]|uniref:Shugoshin 1 n=1 Tax=Microcaecilia unicolor TaxID=1415580 RepID=A0A6P7Y690_9AMPH|nr:shugoshin 1 [Microcaecilia unicolor]
MVHERCAKKSFRDSLEDIKERMKEKRNKQLAKVATANKNLTTKVQGKILQNSCVMLKNVQLNNKALAQALEIEKAKTRQAQDVILHLKQDYQAMKFQIFMLQRKLKLQEDKKAAESKLSALREIISKVTANLLETADLLGPAHDLCFTNYDQRCKSSLLEEKDMTNSTAPLHVPIREGNIGSKISENEMDNFTTVKNPDPLIGHAWQSSERFISVQRGSRGRRAVIHHDLSVSQNEDSKGSNLPQNVLVRHSNYSFKQHDDPCMLNSPESSTSLAKSADVEQVCARTTEGCINESSLGKIPVLEEDLFSLNEDQLNLDRLTLPHLTEMKSSTPKSKPTQSHVKEKATSQTGKERGRKGRADGMNVSLKKPWENSRPRARSKSRERGSNKQPAVKIKMDTSIGSSDAYDFLSEESVHLTPFRQGKGNDESKIEASEQSCSDQCTSENESDDSLYVPHGKKSKRQSIESKLNSGALPSRPRSKRNSVLQKQQQLLGGKEKKNAKSKEDSGSSTSNEKENEKPVGLKTRLGNIPIDTGSEVIQNKLGTGDLPKARHFGLCDVTNFCAASGQKEIRKISCPLLDCGQEKSGTPVRKRRCTFTVNYKEPTLSGKLRRGDRFTDTEFLHSPIFKEKNSKCKSYKNRSLTRYNEAFVGCR